MCIFFSYYRTKEKVRVWLIFNCKILISGDMTEIKSLNPTHLEILGFKHYKKLLIIDGFDVTIFFHYNFWWNINEKNHRNLSALLLIFKKKNHCIYLCDRIVVNLQKIYNVSFISAVNYGFIRKKFIIKHIWFSYPSQIFF